MHTKRTISLLGLIFLALIMLACGHDFWAPANPGSSSGNNPTGAVTKFAFAANFNNGGAGSVSAYTVDNSSGALTAVANSPFTTGANGTIAVGADTSGKFVFAANQAGGVSAFTVDRTNGVLTEVTGSPFATGTTPAWVAVDPAGRFVYVLNGGSNDISGYAVNTTSGALTAFSATVPLVAKPLRAIVDPGGHFLYVALGTAGTAVFKIATDGTLTLTRTVPPTPCAASNDVAVDVNTKFAFIADGATGVCSYAVNGSTGDLSAPINNAVIAAGTNPVSVAVGANGKFLFTANQGSDNVSGFTINADGTLTAMSGSPFASGKTPVDVNVDPSGSFVYTANFGANTLSIFTISSSTLTTPKSATAGTTPNSVVTTQ